MLLLSIITLLGHIASLSQQCVTRKPECDEAQTQENYDQSVESKPESSLDRPEKVCEAFDNGDQQPKNSILADLDTSATRYLETSNSRNMFLKAEFRTREESMISPKAVFPGKTEDDPNSAQTGAFDRFHWKPALAQSLYFLGLQHGFRMIQIKTRRELKGPFFADWRMSVKNLGRWRDGDSTATNYFAHPLQGAATGRIFVNNSDKAKRQQFGRSKEYWESRFKAMLWSTVWSTQFEVGPLSEASIGNVGLYDREGPNRMGWVDLVVTPTAGTGVMIGEDIIDKYILRKWLERKIISKTRIKIYRTFFTPVHSFTNVLGGKTPWNRDNR